MRQRYIRETALSDAIDLIRAAVSQSKDELERFKTTKFRSSISKSSKDLIMTFPLIYDRSIDVKTAALVSKAHEKKCLTLLHMLCTSEWATEAKNAGEFIATFHKNMDMESYDVNMMSIDDLIDHSDEIASLLGDPVTESTENMQLLALLKEDGERLSRERSFPDSIRNISIQDFMVYPSYDGKKTVKLSEAVDGADFNDDKRAELKKANELVPSILIIRFCGVDENTKEKVQYKAVVGVKSRLVPTTGTDIIDHIFLKHNDNNFLLKLVRATTREISFTRDFLLGLSKAKADAISNSKRGSASRIWKTLEVRSNRAKIKKALRQANTAMAITGLMINMEDVEQLKKNNNINLLNVSTSRKIMDAYNLLALIIVDESVESVQFLYDGDDSFETLSFDGLAKDSGDGGMYKKVINMMSKMM